MDTQTIPPTPIKDYTSTVDTSRPFSSVKEAAAIFDKRLLAGEIYSPKPHTPPFIDSWSNLSTSPSPKNFKQDDDHVQNGVLDSLKKLEAELEETKVELKLLKERESQTEIALASLNAKLHKNMSKLAEAEAAEAKKEAASGVTRTVTFREDGEREERIESNPTLSQILTLGEENDYFGSKRERGRMKMKKKPIIPLVGDLFSRKKSSSNASLHNSLFASPNLYFN